MNNFTPPLRKRKCDREPSPNSTIHTGLQLRRLFHVSALFVLLLFGSAARIYGAAAGLLTSGTMPAAATLCPSAVNQPVYSFSVTGSGGGVSISNLQNVSITGFTSGDLTNLKVYWTTTNTFSTANAIVCSKTSPAPGTISFTAATAKATGNAIIFFWITADIAASPTNGSTITVGAMTTANVTGTTTGSSSAGNTLTIHTAPASITGTASVCVGATTVLANSVSGGTWASSATGVASVGLTTGIVDGASANTATITYSTGCGTAATTTVTVNALPTASTVTGGGNYCTGGSGVSVGLGGSQSGVNYQLYNGSSTTGSPVAGTGSAITFGAQTAAGTYTVRATNATTSCVAGMTGSASVSINTLPTTFTISGGGNYCSGGSGVSVGLGGSQSGVNYQLYNGSSTTGSPVAGSGSSITFGTQTTAGTYTVRATNATTSCIADMTGSASVSINALPTTFTVSGGGNYCSGGSGVSVGLGGSQSGVNYQLYNGSSSTGSPVAGTGSSITFGAQTAAGTYTVRATNATTSCVSGMTGSAGLSIDALPATFTTSGGGNYCSGGSGVSVGLGGSQSGVNYQLYNGSSSTGSPVAGTGSSITFGAQTAAGTYTVRATNATTSCVSGMTGSASVNINTLPAAFTVSGGGNYCSGGSGVSVGLGGSQSGVNYQLYNGSSPTGSPIAGTGSSISFGAQTAAGTYTVLATNATTSCVAGMTGSAALGIDALPATFTTSGGGNYCSGGSGVNVDLGGSQSGVNYQLYNGSSTTGSPVAGTGSAITFGAQTAAGAYTVRATNATTSCTSGMTGSVSVSINTLPTTFTVSGGGNYCSGGSGVSVGLGGSQSGVNYQLYNGGSTTGSPVAGTGSSITFGAQTSGGTYTVRATNASTSCVAGMTSSASVSIDALPTTFTVNGGGNYCSGGSGVSVGLGGSQSGVNYQLYNGVSTTGSPVAGTGSSITFGAQTAAGTYTVRATNVSTSCIAGMTSSASVSIDALPTTFTVNGGGNYCNGGSGVSVGLAGSQSGINYQLYNGASTAGSPVAGTGSPITFGAQTAAGTYTVRATNATTSCLAGMTGSTSVSINALPTTFIVSGGGNYCSGGSGVSVALAGSESGVNYQLYNGASTTGSPVAGTGSSITFGAQTAAGTYTVRATNASTSCVAGMTSSASVTIDALPTTFTVNGGGNYCSGGSGVSVGLGGSQSGVNYQLYNGVSTIGSPVAGTGSSISFGAQTAAGTYTVRATNASTSCLAGMTSSASVTVDALPTTFTVNGGGNYCSGGSGVSVALVGSEPGVDYQLYNGSSATGGPVSGTGFSISFGAQTAAGTYTVRATNATTNCITGMSASASVNIDPLPTTFTANGGGDYCAGGSGVSIGLGGSQSGIDYQLYNGSSATGSPVSGTGTSISFGLLTAPGTYTIHATNATTGCVSGMSGAAAVTIDVLPTVFTITGGGYYCSGGSGVNIGLAGSQTSVDYQLYNGSSAIGSAVSGTGSTISFGSQTSAGTYTIQATSSAGCVTDMSSSAAVTVGGAPSATGISNNGPVCAGSTLDLSITGLSNVASILWDGPETITGATSATAHVTGVTLSGGIYTVILSNGSGPGCAVSYSTTATVNALPVSFTLTGGGAYCFGGSGASIATTGSETGVQYTLMIDAAAVLTKAGTGSSLSFNDVTAAATYHVVGVNATTGCQREMTGAPSVSVNSLPAVYALTGGGLYCPGGSSVGIGLGNSDAGVTYQLSNGGSAAGVPVSGTGAAVAFAAQTNAGTYTAVATDATTGCSSNMSSSATVTAGTTPSAGSITGASTVCTGNTTALSDAITGGAWLSDDASIATVSATGVVSGVAAGSVVISYTATNSCGSATTTHAMTVNASPNAGTLSGTATVCAGNSTNLSTTGSGGNWSSGSPSVASVTSTGLVTGNSAGTSIISYTVTGGCGTVAATLVVTVNDVPTAGIISGASTVCAGAATSLSSSVNAGSWSSSDETIATVSTGGIVTGIISGSADISYAVSNGCGSDVVTHSIAVNTSGSAGAISGVGTMCIGNNSSLNTTGTGGNWGSSNPSVAGVNSTGLVTGVSAGTATISYTVIGCGAGNATLVVTVNGTPSPGTITGASAVALGGTIILTNAVSGGAWSASNANVTISSGGIVSGLILGSTTISYAVTTTCGSATATKSVTVVSGVGGSSGILSMCVGQTTTLSNSTAGGVWSSNNTAIATISASGVVTGIMSGMATISYSTSVGIATSIVTVSATPSAITGTKAICQGATTTLNNTATGYGVWTSSDVTVAAIGSATAAVSGIAPGTAIITYTLSSGCLGTTVVTVHTLPAAITGVAGICPGSFVTLNCSTPGGLWTCNDATVATINNSTGVVTAIASGIGDITYTLSTGCKTNTSVTVYAPPVAISGTAILCEATNTNLSSTPGGNWTSSNIAVASIGTSGIVSGLAAGTATISYVSGTGCARSIVVTVNPVPAITGTVLVCPGGAAPLSASIPGGSWTGGSASIATISSVGVVTGIAAGTANFTYTLATGCKDYATGTVNMTPATITGTMKTCLGNTTTLNNTTTGGNWSGSNTAIATVGATTGIVNGITAGTVTVTYTTGAGCYRTATVTINPDPSAIAGGGSPVCPGATITLTDATPGLSWTSSNTAVATVNSSTGLVVGVGAGTATITYTAATTNCITTTEVTINGAPAAITGAATACTGSTITLSDAVTGGAWSSSNIAVATIAAVTGIVTPVASGIVTITYTTGAGCTQTRQITVNNAPTITGYPIVCVGLTTTLSGGGYGTWSSALPSVATIVISGGYVTGVSAGTAVMTFTSAVYTCPATYVVTVIPVPAAITGTTTACTGTIVTLSNTTPGGSWSSSNTAGATVGAATGIVNAVGTGGTVVISYSIGTNCRVTTGFTLRPLPAVIGGTAQVCTPTVTTLTETTSGGTWTSSDMSVATVGTVISASYGVMTGVAAGTTTVTYTITNTGCARSTIVTVTAGPDPGTLASSTSAFTLHTASAPTMLTLSSSGNAGGAWTSNNVSVATVNVTSGVVSAVAAGNATITYTVTGACTNRATRLINVSSGREAGAMAVTSDFALYPNPTPGTFTLTTGEGGTMRVYTMDGREVYSFEVTSGSSEHAIQQGMAAGVYMCRFSGVNGSTANVRLVYER